MARFQKLAAILLGLAMISPLTGQEEPTVDDSEELVNPIPMNWPELPSWSVEELEMLRSGDLELGTDLFKDSIGNLNPEELFGPLPEPELPPEPEIDPDAPFPIPPEFYPSYFANRPAEYLLDPQGLLSTQEQKDRQSFLDYHAGDSEIDLHIYLFDAKQVIPPEGEISETFKRHFNRGNGMTALVYYYYGAPDRAQLVTSPELSAVVGVGALHGALKHSQEQAEQKSEPTSQLESFSTALSIRLYWMERQVAEARGDGTLAGLVDNAEVTVVQSRAKKPESIPPDQKIFFFLGSVALIIAVGGIAIKIRKQHAKKRFLFPEVETKPLLSAPHAAGVGAVIHFGNATLPPSLQREQVPDYLRKM